MASAVVRIADTLTPIPIDLRLFGPGIYHLMQGGRVVYVGASSNLAQRVAAWSSAGWVNWFDSVRVIPADLDNLPDMERGDIARYRPEKNRAGITAQYMSPEAVWRKKRRYQVRVNNELFHSRAEWIRFLARDVSRCHIDQLKLYPPGLGAKEKSLALAEIGFPAPDYSTSQGYPRWLPSAVLAWLSARGPFDDEIEVAA